MKSPLELENGTIVRLLPVRDIKSRRCKRSVTSSRLFGPWQSQRKGFRGSVRRVHLVLQGPGNRCKWKRRISGNLTGNPSRSGAVRVKGFTFSG